MAALLKSAESKDFVGSNPTLSATTARRHGGRYVRWRLCSSLTHLQVRSLRCSTPPSSRPPCRRATLLPERSGASGHWAGRPRGPGPSAGSDSPFCPADSRHRPAGGYVVLGRNIRRFGASAAAASLVLALLATPAAVLARPPLLLGLNLLPPIGAPDSYTTPYQTRLDVDKPGVLANDTDLDSPEIFAELVSGTSHGVLELREEGRIRYEPDNGFSGTDTFTYRPYDGKFYALLAVTVTITVKPRPAATPTPTPTASPTPTPAPTPTPTPRPRPPRRRSFRSRRSRSRSRSRRCRCRRSDSRPSRPRRRSRASLRFRARPRPRPPPRRPARRRPRHPVPTPRPIRRASPNRPRPAAPARSPPGRRAMAAARPRRRV